jgi:hypothetical protein
MPRRTGQARAGFRHDYSVHDIVWLKLEGAVEISQTLLLAP